MSHPKLHDQAERLRALDPRHSFIVQAPAGSGKTELLTQRYLILLETVKQPEEILAITFTKKSSAEMRARIIKSLKKAKEFPEPSNPHESQTWNLAKKVLDRDQQLNWNLLDNPNRLQIQTIDSFNASLTRQLPLLSNFGAPLDIVDDPKPLYQLAVQEFLTHLEENVDWADAIERLLIHVDNDLSIVERLLINMLAKRDQWLHVITLNSQDPLLRQTLEYYLAQVVIDALSHLKDNIPSLCQSDLINIAQYAGTNLKKHKPDSPVVECADLIDLPGTSLNDRKKWLGLCQLLLTKSKPYSWRKSFTIADGFPPPSQAKNAEEKQRLSDMKLRLKELLDELASNDKLHNAFKNLLILPDHQYQETQWHTLAALHDILRIVVAQLKIIFQEHGKIDYIENAQAALSALGTEDEPTDITLALDYRIQHILIDEFQDTSNNQYRLLNKLIAGWQTGDGRTLFVVGDPMQSIYRFREADVGLFIKGREKGIGHLALEPLTLSVNFRSRPEVVQWVNEHFLHVFPQHNDISCGAVSYSESVALPNENHVTEAVFLHPLINKEASDQAEAIIQLIQKTRANHPTQKIAILVRSRTHLNALTPALKAANLPFRALDIEPLATRPVIQDLLSLTRALLHPADRIAWLALLRAPWCGMSLSDLLVVGGDKSRSIIWEQIQRLDILSSLSETGQNHLNRILPILKSTLAERRRHTLRKWIELTWLQLGGPACVDKASDLDDADAFFHLLEKLDDAYDLPDLRRLNEAINKLYAAPNNQADDLLQIMTIHNAKGLEFDIVILPHLEKKSSQDDKQLLQWMERTRFDESNHLLIAPIRGVGEDDSAIYDYITEQQRIKSSHENGRLLYVAATRAKKELHLFFNLETTEHTPIEIKKPTPQSLLEKLWGAISETTKENFLASSFQHVNAILKKNITRSPLKSLAKSWRPPVDIGTFTELSGYHQKQSGFELPDNSLQSIGIVIHQILQQLSQQGLDWLTNKSLLSYMKNHLRLLKVREDNIEPAVILIEKAIKNVLNDKRGLWILENHLESQAEMPLTCVIDGEVISIVIDRTFVDETGTRWIIDYKSTEFYGDDLATFLLAEQKHHEKKLWQYQQALQAIDQRPIKLGLYFPLLPAWQEWCLTPLPITS